MYKKSNQGINGTMGVLNNNLNYQKAGGSNRIGSNIGKG